MSTPTFTLDDIRAAAEKKYGKVIIPLPSGRDLELVNVLRLSKDQRAELLGTQKSMADEDADEIALLEQAIRIPATDASAADELIANLGGDLALLSECFKRYLEGTQAGEA